MFLDYLEIAIKGMKHRKLRSYLTIIGIFIGVTAVVTLISLGQGLQVFIDEQFKKVGGDRILVFPGGKGEAMSSKFSFALAASKLTDSDLKAFRSVRGISYGTGILVSLARIAVKDKTKPGLVFGIPTDKESRNYLKEVDWFAVEKGRYLKEGDRFKAIVGKKTKDKFGEEIKIGDKIYINGYCFEVVGIGKETGHPMHDRKVTIPLKTAREIFKESGYSFLVGRVEKGFEVDNVAKKVEEKLRRRRGVKKGEEDFRVETSQNVVETFRNVLLMVQIVLVGIAAISLFVGGVGIMNTMYTSVLERTREIGVMKAVGAKNRDVLMIFLIESGILGLIGGVLGLIFGAILSVIVENVIHQYGIGAFRSYLGIDLILGSLLFSFIIGCISGLLPSYQASKLNPVDALRR